ncbi:MAG: HlyD family type I secretion periplasmic adaptor subunit [Ideonella sp.]|nr:HlyD family type I secretion periplasmic adaptor subunit [Ideonella sp.]
MSNKPPHTTPGPAPQPAKPEAQRASHWATWRDLGRKYAAVAQAAWQHDKAHPRPNRQAEELAFLPAALSIQDTPAHPAPRRALWVIMALFTIAVLWSLLGELDIVVVAPGRIVVADRSKVIQPLEAGVVKAIHVRDGDLVQAGQTLLELDPTATEADAQRLQVQRQAAQQAATVAQTLLAHWASSTPPAWPHAQDAAGAALLRTQWQGIQDQKAQNTALVAQRQAELATAQQVLAKLDATLPLVAQRERDVAQLADQGFFSGHARQDRTRERIEMERDRVTAQAQVQEAKAALAQAQQAAQAFNSDTLRKLTEQQRDAELQTQQASAEEQKAQQRRTQTTLNAPIAGKVQQLAIHTRGGVVTPAQALMVIVPQGADMLAEVSIANLDMGFVQAGQPVTIKLEAYPYTRFGTLQAHIQHLAADAVVDEKTGARFPATLRIAAPDKTAPNHSPTPIKLAPGLNLTAEIHTGKRRVIDFLISPLRQEVESAGRGLLVV